MTKISSKLGHFQFQIFIILRGNFEISNFKTIVFSHAFFFDISLIYLVSRIKNEYKKFATWAGMIHYNIILFYSMLSFCVRNSTIVSFVLVILNLNVSLISICFPLVLGLKLISLFVI